MHQILPRLVLGLVAVSSAALVAADSRAAWPPCENLSDAECAALGPADMADPANWPNDPGYGYSPESSGQWNYYSFLPTPSGGLMVRPDETSSGMSIDLAWRWTQGDDRIRIAVTDSGIKWDEADIADRAWLNAGELATHKPLHMDGSACAGMAELDGFDCNMDGILSVSDFVDTPALQPTDKNLNGILDAGDLIIALSDGIDDDGNGYVDDISGWDFMKDDNDPYDDTRYGHGTGEAKDSTSEGNNGMGEIGGCSRCRFIPMRVGDSFITDVNNFGEAVVYATDNGARVVQCALGTVNNNSFTQAALDYAYAKGVLVITSMADENARHHNMPATSNHTLPVHAIQYAPAGNEASNVESYLDFNPCTNFGGQNTLSASGTGCSSEATGQLSGMSGLVMSAGLKYALSPPLTAAEAQQLWMQTADDIDVPESRGCGDECKYKWSQKGFDQRFGYGRVNANSAVEWVKDGKIPPEVDVTRPFWFEVLYADQVTGPVEIRGTVAAKRATSYDYWVEWAPGVQPLDEAFVEIARADNVAPDVVTGSDEPLALLDVRTIDTTHEPDVDSPHGENAHTITVRVRALAHYGGAVGDVPGEMRRTYAIHRDPDLVQGFPLYLGSSGEQSPKMADIDGDGTLDLIVGTSDGRLHVWKLTADGPEYLPGFPFVGPRIDGLAETPVPDKPSYLAAPAYASGEVNPALAGSSYTIAPAIADLDGDGAPEIVVSTWNGFISVVSSDGTMVPGWPVRLPEVPSCPLDGSVPSGPCMSTNAIIDRGSFAAPVLEDMDKDGDLDIVMAGFDGKVYVFDKDGAPVSGWPVEVHFPASSPLEVEEPARGRILSTPAVGDFDGDGYPEVFVGSNERLGQGEQAGAVYLIDGRGTAAGPEPYLPNWPVTMTSLLIFPLVAEGVGNCGVIGTIDGTLAAVIHGNASSPLGLPADPGPQPDLNVTPPNTIPTWVDPDTGVGRPGIAPTGRFGPLSKAERDDVMFPLFANPSLGDIDQDGIADIIASGSSLSLAQSLAGAKVNKPGQQLVAVWSGKTGDMLPASPFLLEDFSFFNSHAIVDLTNDDYPEVIAGSGGYFLHAWDGCGREPAGWPKFTGQWIIPTPAVGDLDGDGKLELAVGTRSGWLYVWRTEGRSDGMVLWESFHHDNRNTGNLDVPLEQGDPTRKAARPLDLEFCNTVLSAPPPLEPAGGCGACAVGQRSNDRVGVLFFLAVAALARRRRGQS